MAVEAEDIFLGETGFLQAEKDNDDFQWWTLCVKAGSLASLGKERGREASPRVDWQP